MTLTLQAIGVVLLGCTAIVVCCAALAPLFDENELPTDEPSWDEGRFFHGDGCPSPNGGVCTCFDWSGIMDDPRPGEVLREAQKGVGL